MAEVTISALPAAPSLGDGDYFPIVNVTGTATTRKLTGSQLLAYVNAGLPFETAGTAATLVNAHLADLTAHLAANIVVDPSGFGGNLDNTVVDVQALANAVDLLTIIPQTPGVFSVNGDTGPDVVLTAAGLGAVDATTVGANNGVAPLDNLGLVPTTNLPDIVFSVNGLHGLVDLLASNVPIDNTAFTGNLVGVDDVQGAMAIFDTFVGGGGGGSYNPAAVAITGGTVAGLSALGMGTTTYSGGHITSGVMNPATAVVIEQAFTQTATNPIDKWVGSPLFVNFNATFNGPTTPDSYTSNFGPRGLIELEGTATYGTNQNVSHFSPLGFSHQLIVKNNAGGTRTLVPSWGFMSAQQFKADGATVTVSRPDFAYGGAAFVDTNLYGSINAGQMNLSGTYEITSFLSGPGLGGNAHAARRVGFKVLDSGTVPAGLAHAGFGAETENLYYGADIDLGALLGYDAIGSGSGAILDEQIGFYVKRLIGATRNVGMRCDTGIELWADTNTFAATGALSPLSVGGTHTFDYANPIMVGFAFGGTWAFNQDASGFGAIVAFNLNAVIKNTSTNSGTVFPTNNLIQAIPTYRADTQTITATNLHNFHSFPTFDRVTGGVLNVSSYVDYYAGMTFNAGVTMTNRYAMFVADPTGSGTQLANNWGIYIDTLAKGTSLNVGLINLNPSVLQGPVYGGIVNGTDLVFSSTAAATKGVIRFDNPSVEFITTNTTQTAPYAMALADATVTMNASSTNQARGFVWSPTVSYSQTGFVFGAAQAFVDRAIYKNTVGSGNINLGPLVAFAAVPTIQADTATITGDYTGFQSTPTTARLTSGGLTLATVYNVLAGLTVGANTTVTNRTGLLVQNPTNGGILTTNIGVDIAAQTATTLAIGFRNASTSVYTPQNVTVASAATFFVPTARVIAFTCPTGTTTITGTPSISPGQDGQVFTLINVDSADALVLRDNGTFAGSGLHLAATSITLGPRDSITLIYSTAGGGWLQISQTNVL